MFRRLLVINVILITTPSAASAQPGNATPSAKSAVPDPNRPTLKRSTPPPIQGALAKEIHSHDPDCGSNCLYMCLRLKGIAGTREQVKAEVPMTPKGASMLDLREAARKRGLEVEVVEITPAELLKRLPAIARFSAAGSADEGHYVVVTKTESDGGVTLIDGTTGVTSSLAPVAFERGFSGYALVTQPKPWGRWLSGLNIALMAVIAVEAAVVIILWMRRTGAEPAPEPTPDTQPRPEHA